MFNNNHVDLITIKYYVVHDMQDDSTYNCKDMEAVKGFIRNNAEALKLITDETIIWSFNSNETQACICYKNNGHWITENYLIKEAYFKIYTAV